MGHLDDYIPSDVVEAARAQLARVGPPVGAGGLILPPTGEPSPGMTLRAALDAELQRESMLYEWHYYGDDAVAIAGNASVDVPLPMDPAAFFLGLSLHYRVAAGTALRNITVQLIQGGDKQMFREAMPLSGLVTNATGLAGSWLFPREWICFPGGSAVIRVATRTAAAAVLEIHTGGYKVRVA